MVAIKNEGRSGGAVDTARRQTGTPAFALKMTRDTMQRPINPRRTAETRDDLAALPNDPASVFQWVRAIQRQVSRSYANTPNPIALSDDLSLGVTSHSRESNLSEFTILSRRSPVTRIVCRPGLNTVAMTTEGQRGVMWLGNEPAPGTADPTPEHAYEVLRQAATLITPHNAPWIPTPSSGKRP